MNPKPLPLNPSSLILHPWLPQPLPNQQLAPIIGTWPRSISTITPPPPPGRKSPRQSPGAMRRATPTRPASISRASTPAASWKTPEGGSPTSSAADLAGPQPDRLILTASGTEANNLAILGIARARGQAGQVVLSAIEHASVIGPAEHLLEQGFRLDTLGVTGDGVVCVDRLAPLLGPQTRVVSVMLGNHETGVLQPVAELAAMCNHAGVPLHSDAVAVAGKLPIDFRRLGLAAMSVAAHKFRGPPGIAALLLRHDVALRTALLRRPSAAGPPPRHRAGRPGRRHGHRVGTLAARAGVRAATTDRPARSARSGPEGRLPGGRHPRPGRPTAAQHDQHRLSRPGRPDLAGGVGHGGRGLLGRGRLRQRLQRAFADVAGDAASQRRWWAVPFV